MEEKRREILWCCEMSPQLTLWEKQNNQNQPLWPDPPVQTNSAPAPHPLITRCSSSIGCSVSSSSGKTARACYGIVWGSCNRCLGREAVPARYCARRWYIIGLFSAHHWQGKDSEAAASSQPTEILEVFCKSGDVLCDEYLGPSR